MLEKMNIRGLLQKLQTTGLTEHTSEHSVLLFFLVLPGNVETQLR